MITHRRLSGSLWILTLSLLFGRPAPAHADAKSHPWDLSIRTGASFGSITIEKPTRGTAGQTTTETYQLGGVPLGAALNFDWHERFTGFLGPTFLVDLPNKVVIRQGMDLGGSIHILGGARRLARIGDAFSMVAANPFNLSLVLRAGLHNYGTSINNVEFSGGAFEVRSGLEYRKDVDSARAYGSEILATVLTLPASVTRIRYQAFEFHLFWRTFL